MTQNPDVRFPFRRAAACVPAVLMSVALACALSSCGGGTKGTSQVAVKVNKDEISVLQVNQRLSRISAAGLSDDQKLNAQKTTVEGLVDQQLLIEQARSKQLDRDPGVMSAIEAAKAQILAEAYVQKQILPNAKPTDAEIQKYYDDNPTLFAARRVYAIQEAFVPAMSDEQREELKKRLAKGDLDAGIRYLKSQEVKVSANVGVRPAEQVPMNILTRLSMARDGSVEMFDGPNGSAHIIKLASSQLAPVDAAAARPSIEQFLTNRKRDELLHDEVKRLRSDAKIEYVGEFQKLAMQPGAAPAAGTSTAAAAGVAAAPAAAAVPAAAAASDSTSKGIKGL